MYGFTNYWRHNMSNSCHYIDTYMIHVDAIDVKKLVR